MYQIVFGALYLLSLLPMRVLYTLGDVCTFILYSVAKYRREVVETNLLQAFPEKSEIERKAIAKKFYRNFVDHWAETLKLLSCSRKKLRQMATGNYQIFDQLHASGRSVQVNLGHFFNWELMTLHAGISQPYTFLTVYLPQSNKIMNRLVLYIRGRWGNPLLPSNDMARAIIPWRKKQYLIALGADQRPAFPDTSYWLNFLNRPAGFVKGPEKFARGQRLPVVMMTTSKPKRGQYHFEYFLLAEDSLALPEGELIRRYVRHLEENIRLHPELYLWSHKRWKHGFKPEYEKLWVDDSVPVIPG